MLKLWISLSLIILSYSPSSFAQEWTWVKGNSSLNQAGIYGNKGQAAAANNPGGRNQPSTWTDQNGDLWLFGGLGEDVNSFFGRSNDLWKFDLQSNQWAWISGAPNRNQIGVYTATMTNAANPGSRSGAVQWADGNGNLWLFGGFGYAATASNGRLNDLWKFDPTSNEWTWAGGSNTKNQVGSYGLLGQGSVNNIPGARENATSWTDASGNFWLFGGDGYDAAGHCGVLNDLWKFDPTSNEWTWMAGDSLGEQTGQYSNGGQPSARHSQVSWVDDNGDFWIFGGYGYDAMGNLGRLNDLWAYSAASNEWIWVSGQSTGNSSSIYGTQGQADPLNEPGGRSNMTSWKDIDGNLWLLGGYGQAVAGSFGRLNDLWKFDMVSQQWIWMHGGITSNQIADYGTIGQPAATNRSGARRDAAAWEGQDGALWMFGGYGLTTSLAFGQLNDLWVYHPNRAPQHSEITTDTTICIGAGSLNIPINIWDLDGDSLQFIFSSANATLLPLSGLSLSTSNGYHYTLQITPEANQFGSGAIGLQIIDEHGGIENIGLVVEILPAFINLIDTSLCANSYYAGGAFQTTSGIYYDTLSSVWGCDSIIITQVDFEPKPLTIREVYICEGDSYYAGGAYQNSTGTYYDVYNLSKGCDSTVETRLRLRPTMANNIFVEISSGESYYAGGAWQTVAGVYQDVYQNLLGCDSVVFTHLDVLPATIRNSGKALRELKTTASISESDIKVYPNPTSHQLHIDFDVETESTNYNLSILDAQGRLLRTVLSQTYQQLTIDVGDLLPGVYFVRIQGEQELIGNIKFIKS